MGLLGMRFFADGLFTTHHHFMRSMRPGAVVHNIGRRYLPYRSIPTPKFLTNHIQPCLGKSRLVPVSLLLTFVVQAVGEPPFFMAASAFFAIKDAVASAREDHGEAGFFRLNLPASSERWVGLSQFVVVVNPSFFCCSVFGIVPSVSALR